MAVRLLSNGDVETGPERPSQKPPLYADLSEVGGFFLGPLTPILCLVLFLAVQTLSARAATDACRRLKVAEELGGRNLAGASKPGTRVQTVISCVAARGSLPDSPRSNASIGPTASIFPSVAVEGRPNPDRCPQESRRQCP